MGISGFSKDFQSQFPFAFGEIKRRPTDKNKEGFISQECSFLIHTVDHLYIDLNSLIHTSTLTKKENKKNKKNKKIQHDKIDDEIPEQTPNLSSEPAQILQNITIKEPTDLNQIVQEVLKKLKHIQRLMKPRKTLFISMDGVAPLSKMEKQKKSRIDILTKSSNSSQAMITPSSILMIKLEIAIKKWFKTTKDIQMMILSGTNEPGEGEIKIMNHISSNNDINDNYIIISPDSDFILLMLCCFEKTNIFLCEPTNLISFTCYSKSALMDHFNTLIPSKSGKNIYLFTSNPAQISVDFTLLSLLRGNDYIPGISRWTKFKHVFDQYIQFKKQNDFSLLELHHNEKNENFWKLNISNLVKLHDHDDLEEHKDLNQLKIENYFDAILWNLNMYTCSFDYDPIYHVKYEYLSMGEVKEYIEKMGIQTIDGPRIIQKSHPFTSYLFSMNILPKSTYKIFFPKEVNDNLTDEMIAILEENFSGHVKVEELLKVSKKFLDMFPHGVSELYQNSNWKIGKKGRICKIHFKKSIDKKKKRKIENSDDEPPKKKIEKQIQVPTKYRELRELLIHKISTMTDEELLNFAK
eukprot:gene7806-12280_t